MSSESHLNSRIIPPPPTTTTTTVISSSTMQEAQTSTTIFRKLNADLILQWLNHHRQLHSLTPATTTTTATTLRSKYWPFVNIKVPNYNRKTDVKVRLKLTVDIGQSLHKTLHYNIHRDFDKTSLGKSTELKLNLINQFVSNVFLPSVQRIDNFANMISNNSSPKENFNSDRLTNISKQVHDIFADKYYHRHHQKSRHPYPMEHRPHSNMMMIMAMEPRATFSSWNQTTNDDDYDENTLLELTPTRSKPNVAQINNLFTQWEKIQRIKRHIDTSSNNLTNLSLNSALDSRIISTAFVHSPLYSLSGSIRKNIEKMLENIYEHSENHLLSLKRQWLTLVDDKNYPRQTQIKFVLNNEVKNNSIINKLVPTIQTRDILDPVEIYVGSEDYIDNKQSNMNDWFQQRADIEIRYPFVNKTKRPTMSPVRRIRRDYSDETANNNNEDDILPQTDEDDDTKQEKNEEKSVEKREKDDNDSSEKHKKAKKLSYKHERYDNNNGKNHHYEENTKELDEEKEDNNEREQSDQQDEQKSSKQEESVEQQNLVSDQHKDSKRSMKNHRLANSDYNDANPIISKNAIQQRLVGESNAAEQTVTSDDVNDEYERKMSDAINSEEENMKLNYDTESENGKKQHIKVNKKIENSGNKLREKILVEKEQEQDDESIGQAKNEQKRRQKEIDQNERRQKLLNKEIENMNSEEEKEQEQEDEK
ncbi:unnamed protein product [Didymodactylos carnosus]|uniref:Uncharacterized protein n=1 Tax=Didymodactylos carnosus TaxID=1234261 RepID=A0A813UY53_9BILA|nr:unnamed protein product [Didymodactylos carnosus]CAF3616722.1 unnamed protein product [Didymodactylos carnosus]